MHNLTLPSRAQRRLARLHLQDLSRKARSRLAFIDWYFAHDRNASLTCRRFGISRQTFYRWLRRYQPFNLAALEDRSCVPKRRRQRAWTTDEVLAVRDHRERYPRWGKEKLQRLLAGAGIHLSVSTVGRILAYLKKAGQLKEPLRRSLVGRRSWSRPYATRKPRDYQPRAPGDLVQIDTTDIRPCSGVVLKQFTTVDVVSRWSVPTIASNATASLALRALDALQARAPFPVRAIQVDGGSEFMADFEAACKARGILLFELPPRSPKLNGRVERANRTYKDEFYDCSSSEPTVKSFAHDLRRWEHTYNHIRPHQALGYLTPAQFVAAWQSTNHSEEVLSRTS
jgi:transposase InsO family protein